ncbi:hypothetical protein BHE74_00022530 [Ensete ventricosum]|nr:hypothetical protein GW17_00016573 [Ensete ventricosum]RWW69847.1 hypothetical protein BHE74_00022530 [Ensete ventricosum]RZS25909.1 hypothetical protein BHM03_00059173 [Ensete ventricosum]
MKSLSFVPFTHALALSAIWTPSWMKSATASKSFSLRPLVVIAGVPTRIPPGTRALLSPSQHQDSNQNESEHYGVGRVRTGNGPTWHRVLVECDRTDVQDFLNPSSIDTLS